MTDTDSLTRLFYVSRNAVTDDADTLREQINAILGVAQTRNASMGVTGLLTFNQGFFAQVLEGDEDSVEELFECIQMDPRHDDVVVLDIQPVRERAFADWSMGFVGADPGMDQLFQEMRIDDPRKCAEGDAASLLSRMRDLALRNEVGLRAA